MKETELAAHIVDWLRGEKWDVYQEVVSLGRRCDIIAVKKFDYVTMGWAIECKASASLKVLEQACMWMLPMRSVAVPVGGGSVLFEKCAMNEKIGVLRVGKNGYIYESRSAPLMREHYRYWHDRFMPRWLHPDQKLSIAGEKNGDYSTPYKRSMREVRNFLKENPGSTTQELYAALGKLHYASKASFRGCVRSCLIQFEKNWCKVDKNEKPYRFYVKENEGK